MKTLHIVRHGNTFEAGAEPLRIGSRTDLPLTRSGEQQAIALGTWFKRRQITFAAVLAGPLVRTRSTAELILNAAASTTRVRTVSWLNEIDHGPDEGRPERDVISRVGSSAISLWDRQAIPPPLWQVDSDDLEHQCSTAIVGLPSGHSLLVTSNGIARFILRATKLVNSLSSLKLRTGAVGELAFAGSAPRLLCWDVRPDEQFEASEDYGPAER